MSEQTPVLPGFGRWPRKGTKSALCLALWNAGLNEAEIGQRLRWQEHTVASVISNWRTYGANVKSRSEWLEIRAEPNHE